MLDERGNLSRYDIPLTRDGFCRIRTFRMQGTTWQVGYLTSSRPNSLVQLDAATPLIDAFGYTIRDTAGLEARGVVNLVVVDGQGGASRNIAGIVVLPDGAVRLQGHGIPGRSYRVQMTRELGINPWETLGTVLTDSIGTWVFEHPASGVAEARYYRTLE